MSWYSRNWKYRLPIDVPAASVGSTLVDFPVYVDLNNAPASARTHFFANAAGDGADLVITTSDGQTEVPLEVSRIDAAGEHAHLYFKAPQLSGASDSRFYVYYGNAAALARSAGHAFGRNAVWASVFEAVYHLEESPDDAAPQLTDATGNGHDATALGAMTSADSVIATVGHGVEFDGINDYASVPNDAGLDINAGDLSMTAIIRPNVLSGVQAFFAKRYFNSSTDAGGYEFSVRGDGQLSADLDTRSDIGGSYMNVRSAGTINAGVHTFVGVTHDRSGDCTFYINGSADSSVDISSQAGLDINTPNIAEIGSGNAVITTSGKGRFNGVIDELRVSRNVLSADWIQATHANLMTPATFSTFGQVQTQLVAAMLEPASPVALYLCDDTTGSTLTDWMGNHDASLPNGASLGEPAIAIDGGSAVALLNSASHYADIGGLGTLGSSASGGATFITWIKTTDTYDRVLTQLRTGGTDTLEVAVNRFYNGNLEARMVDATGNTILTRTTGALRINDGQPHMVAVVWRPGNADILVYVDGQLQPVAASISEPNVNPGDFTYGKLGAPSNLTSYLDAALDGIAFYAAELTADAIEEIYIAGTGLVFTDGSADLAGATSATATGQLAITAATDLLTGASLTADVSISAEAACNVQSTTMASTPGRLVTDAQITLAADSLLAPAGLLVRGSTTNLAIASNAISNVIIDFIEAHIDFEKPGWTELDQPPVVTGQGATVTIAAIAPALQRGQNAMRINLEDAQTGTAALTRTLSEAMDPLHLRLYLQVQKMAAGQITCVRGRSLSGTIAWALQYDANTGRMTLALSGGQSCEAALTGMNGWVCIGLTLDVASARAELFIRGMPEASCEAWAAPLSTASIEFGCLEQTSDAHGAIDFDELMIASRYAGALLPPPTSLPQAMYHPLQSADRWLAETF